MVKHNLFSPSIGGFFPPDVDVPSDAVEVSKDVEEFLRRAVIWGADSFTVDIDKAVVTYPPELYEYVSQYNAPIKFPDIRSDDIL